MLAFQPLRRALVAASLLCLPMLVQAQPFPTKPVKIVVAFGAGVVDTGARVMAKALSEKWGQPVIVENVTGAGGNIAAEQVARSIGDGSVFLVTGRNIIVNPFLFQKVAYTPFKDLLPVSIFANLPYVIVTHPSVPARTLTELVGYAKANPGKLNFGSGGIGTTPHISGELFKLKAGLNMVHVPYKGSAATVAALVGGQIDLAIDSVTPYLGFIQRGDVRVIAATGANRIAKLPNVPTTKEVGFGEFQVAAWLSVWAPGTTAPSVIEQVNKDIMTVMELPEVRSQFARLEMEPASLPMLQLHEYLRAETKQWAEVVRISGAKAD